MKKTRITLPELALVADTRASLGAGLGFLLADRLSPDQRRAVGWTLTLFGALSRIPLAFEVLGGRRLSESETAYNQTATGSHPDRWERPARRGALAGR
jgi:hypothetical protein